MLVGRNAVSPKWLPKHGFREAVPSEGRGRFGNRDIEPEMSSQKSLFSIRVPAGVQITELCADDQQGDIKVEHGPPDYGGGPLLIDAARAGYTGDFTSRSPPHPPS